MLLPVAVPTPAIRRVMAPMMRRAGLVPVGTGRRAGRPPRDIDAASIRFEPGAVLAIPMVWGDMDYSASGTCTEVWPDGRVLAFGHSMYGEGNSTLPIATGFVHMVSHHADRSVAVYAGRGPLLRVSEWRTGQEGDAEQEVAHPLIKSLMLWNNNTMNADHCLDRIRSWIHSPVPPTPTTALPLPLL